jgi:hypothetical protein
MILMMIMHEIRVIMMHDLMYAQKRIVSVTLDIECYDDLYLEDFDWKDLLELEGDEKVHVTIKQLADVY